MMTLRVSILRLHTHRIAALRAQCCIGTVTPLLPLPIAGAGINLLSSLIFCLRPVSSWSSNQHFRWLANRIANVAHGVDQRRIANFFSQAPDEDLHQFRVVFVCMLPDAFA